MSFASHPKAQFWSKENIDKDGNFIDPNNVLKNSKDLYKFDCYKCNHTFEAKPYNITHTSRPSWCQYCCDPPKLLCTNNNCEDCYKKSFASTDYSKYIHPNCKIDTRSVFAGSDIVVTFICPNEKCKHTFEKNLRDVKHGYFCPYCPNSGRKKICDDESCQPCLKKTFASHPKAIFWSTKNKIQPRKVPIGRSQQKYWFDCPECNNDFQMSTSHISSNNHWCPYCKNKTELKLHKALKEVYPNIETQFYAQWCKNYRNLPLPFDFVLEEFKIIIELDGDQHFVQVGKWAPPEEQQARDLYKMKCANDNKYSVIRISQYDVFNDTIEWSTILQESIREINEKKEVHNYFISYKEDKYINFI